VQECVHKIKQTTKQENACGALKDGNLEISTKRFALGPLLCHKTLTKFCFHFHAQDIPLRFASVEAYSSAHCKHFFLFNFLGEEKDDWGKRLFVFTLYPTLITLSTDQKI
jgi:hypothetical protein